MNLITGEINWESTEKKVIQRNKTFSNDVLELYVDRLSCFNSDEKPYFYNHDRKILISILGHIYNLKEIKSKYSILKVNDAEIIEELYALKKDRLILELDGIFLIFIFDTIVQKGYVFQSEYGFSRPFYYSLTQNGVVFSTSLKRLLEKIPLKRELNINAVYDFLYYEQIIPNELTLIKGIKKLIPQRYMVFDLFTKTVFVKSLIARRKRISIKTAKENIITSIEKNMFRIYGELKKEKLAITLTAGWDTNLLLHFLSKIAFEKIYAVTLSGGAEISEISSVKSIIDNYDKIEHLNSEIREDIVDIFPEIVWTYEGYVFESGIFLRYELAKLLQKEGSKYVFLGACADQVFVMPITIWVVKHIKKRLINREHRFRLNILSHKYDIKIEMLFDYLLKMHEIALNNFGIQGIYPFLNKETLQIGKTLRVFNFRKRLYRNRIKKTINPSIIRYLAKSGAVVDINHLFNINKSQLIKIFNQEFINKILSSTQIEKILQKPKDYTLLIFQLIYIYLFNELFISGRFDTKFDDIRLNAPLSMFL
ncbi:MAG: asparagine synthase-related protein [Candidatus Odinarchaeota archaeon]